MIFYNKRKLQSQNFQFSETTFAHPSGSKIICRIRMDTGNWNLAPTLSSYRKSVIRKLKKVVQMVIGSLNFFFS